MIPLVGGDSGDVWHMALDPVLEVLVADGPRITPSVAQHMVEPEEAHRWPHAYVHLAQMHEDLHQGDGVWRQVLQLESTRLQQREEGGEWEHQPGKALGGEVYELTGPQADEWGDPTSDLVLISGPLPANLLPQLPKVFE
jgi:hypothetical protein